MDKTSCYCFVISWLRFITFSLFPFLFTVSFKALHFAQNFITYFMKIASFLSNFIHLFYHLQIPKVLKVYTCDTNFKLIFNPVVTSLTVLKQAGKTFSLSLLIDFWITAIYVSKTNITLYKTLSTFACKYYFSCLFLYIRSVLEYIME